ncbi:MAG: hypothetical protein AAGE52_34425 [Myxococcota bacterium]
MCWALVMRILSSFVLVLVGCGAPSAPPRSESQTAESSDRAEVPQGAPSADAPLCLPLVSGCGCAYQCARGEREVDGQWQVSHDFQDSRLDNATVQRWCFDAAGRGRPAQDGDRDGCREVFFDGTPCGGECIPTTAFLECHAVDQHCEGS